MLPLKDSQVRKLLQQCDDFNYKHIFRMPRKLRKGNLFLGVFNYAGAFVYRTFSLPCACKQRRQWHPTPVLLPGKSHGQRSLVGCSPWVAKSLTQLRDFTFTFHFHTLEKEMATHSSVLTWRIPGTGEPGGLPSMGSHRVGHDWSNLAAAAAVPVKFLHILYILA